MHEEHSNGYEASQEEFFDAVERSKSSIAAALAAHKKSAVKPIEKTPKAPERFARPGDGGLPWEHGGREHSAKLRRKARLASSRPRNTLEAKAYRARQRAKRVEEASVVTALLADLPMPGPALDKVELVVGEIKLDEWLALKGPRQRQIAPLRSSLLATRVLLLTMRAERGTGDDPGPTEFSRRLAGIGIAMDRRRAHDRLRMIQSLEQADGPWCVMG